MNLVDSSGWVEFFLDHPNAGFFRPALEEVETLVVPTIAIFEVYRVIVRKRGEAEAVQCAGIMNSAQVIGLNHALAVSAAATAHLERLAMSDAIILTTARMFGATLWTQDVDLGSFAGVKFKAK